MKGYTFRLAGYKDLMTDRIWQLNGLNLGERMKIEN